MIICTSAELAKAPEIFIDFTKVGTKGPSSGRPIRDSMPAKKGWKDAYAGATTGLVVLD